MPAEKGLEDLVKVLLSKGADIESKDYNNRTSLHKAAEEDSQPCTAEEIMEKLDWAAGQEYKYGS